MARELIDVGHPGEHPYNWLAHRQLDTALSRAAREHAHGRLVDIGCGQKPYRSLFAEFVTEHVGVDHPDSPHVPDAVDVQASAYAIPEPDASFDTALMSEVLEHLERPLDALREAHRLLRQDAKIIVTTPLVWVLHEEPRDFYRYTPHALEHLLREAGFSEIRVDPISGQWGTLALMGSYALTRSPAQRVPRVSAAVARGAQRIALRLDERWPQPWLSWNHLAVATRR
jgi:ubiquinone/menaquinone biosynthesis C-methylase UbiE